MKNCETFETLGPWWICIWASGCYTADSGARFPFKTSICSRYNKPLHHTQRCVEHATAMLQRSLLGTDQDVVSSWCLSIDPGNDEMFQKSLTLVLRGRTQLDTRGLETGYRTSWCPRAATLDGRIIWKYLPVSAEAVGNVLALAHHRRSTCEILCYCPGHMEVKLDFGGSECMRISCQSPSCSLRAEDPHPTTPHKKNLTSQSSKIAICATLLSAQVLIQTEKKPDALPHHHWNAADLVEVAHVISGKVENQLNMLDILLLTWKCLIHRKAEKDWKGGIASCNIGWISEWIIPIHPSLY